MHSQKGVGYFYLLSTQVKVRVRDRKKAEGVIAIPETPWYDPFLREYRNWKG